MPGAYAWSLCLELMPGAYAWRLQPSWPGWSPTCVGRHGAKRTKGVRQSQRPSDEPRGASADGARDPLSSGASPVQAPDQNPLHHGLVALATTAPSQGCSRPLPTSNKNATVVLSRLLPAIPRMVCSYDGDCPGR